MSQLEAETAINPVKQGQVIEQIELQENYLDTLNTVLKKLEDKLNFVLMSENELNSDGLEQVELCELASIIRNKNTRINSMTDVIVSINNRLEL